MNCLVFSWRVQVNFCLHKETKQIRWNHRRSFFVKLWLNLLSRDGNFYHKQFPFRSRTPIMTVHSKASSATTITFNLSERREYSVSTLNTFYHNKEYSLTNGFCIFTFYDDIIDISVISSIFQLFFLLIRRIETKKHLLDILTKVKSNFSQRRILETITRCLSLCLNKHGLKGFLSFLSCPRISKCILVGFLC